MHSKISSFWPHLPTKHFLEYITYVNKQTHPVLSKPLPPYYALFLLIWWLVLSSPLT